MHFLRITAANGTRQHIPENYVLKITTATDTQDSGSAYRAPNVARGRITEVKYYDGATTTAGAIVVNTVAAYAPGGVKYQYGEQTVDGAFNEIFSN